MLKCMRGHALIGSIGSESNGTKLRDLALKLARQKL
jgi:hypothetical protein